MKRGEPADFSATMRIYWEDTDAAGIVFYANYLKFFERARTEWLRSLGFGQEALRTDAGIAFVVSETRLRYRRPARLDDVIDVSVAVASAVRPFCTSAIASSPNASSLARAFPTPASASTARSRAHARANEPASWIISLSRCGASSIPAATSMAERPSSVALASPSAASTLAHFASSALRPARVDLCSEAR